MFLFLEFVIVANAEPHRLAGHDFQSGRNTIILGGQTTTLKLGKTPSRVPWIYVPLMTRQEICGTGQGINCLMVNVILGASSSEDTPASQGISIFGLEVNDDSTQIMHPTFGGKYHWSTRVGKDSYKRKKKSFPDVPPTQEQRRAVRNEMVETADAVLYINRLECTDQMISKLWTPYIDGFPADLWHSDFITGMGLTSLGATTTEEGVVDGKKK